MNAAKAIFSLVRTFVRTDGAVKKVAESALPKIVHGGPVGAACKWLMGLHALAAIAVREILGRAGVKYHSGVATIVSACDVIVSGKMVPSLELGPIETAATSLVPWASAITIVAMAAIYPRIVAEAFAELLDWAEDSFGGWL